jgi:type II secretory pathway pseudopilin PulG
MGDVVIAVFGVVAVVFATVCVVFATARARKDQRRQDRLSIAFDRAQAVRTRGRGLQGNPYGGYAEPASTARYDRGGK